MPCVTASRARCLHLVGGQDRATWVPICNPQMCQQPLGVMRVWGRLLWYGGSRCLSLSPPQPGPPAHPTEHPMAPGSETGHRRPLQCNLMG